MLSRSSAIQNKGQFLWASVAPDAPSHAALMDSVSADIAIIGGGLAGVSSALHLAQAGADVVLVEADHIGSGAALASAGVVAPQLVRTTPDQVLAKLGREAGEGILKLVAESGDYLFDLLDRLGVECGAEQSGFIAPSTSRHAFRELQDIQQQWLPYRSDLRILDFKETEGLTGCKGYAAALLDTSGGMLDPLACVQGLARQAQLAGARIFEGSKVASIERNGDGWKVLTAQGDIRASKVLLAANGGNGVLHRNLAGTTLPLPVIEVATQPLSAAMRAEILPQRHALTDLEADVFSLRYADGNRLVTAFPSKGHPSDAMIEKRVNDRLKAMLAHYHPVKLDYVWRGLGQVNSDLLPRVVRVDENMLAIQACNGRGLGINTVIGREVALMMSRGGSTRITPQPPRKISGFLIARYLPSLIMSGALMAKQVRQRLGF
ncbi:FAD-dependent oxidoreductase [Altererythrobacter indicus]|uniref:FAD-dependent oxidoreductase n=1 Tax=Altericroceibacterium indicum TaxID=374177 RepID=A0A845A5Q0_9SPHN|nr:FAD-dependent oxidoreductase [Altericroceibacterium indicum]MXP25510.1 FAD-dependent oxidoreductase [Altericroceibacterium indicum]